MININFTCDRCGATITGAIGYVCVDWQDGIDMINANQVRGDNEFEKCNYCPDCIKEISDFVRKRKEAGDTGKAKAADTPKTVEENAGMAKEAIKDTGNGPGEVEAPKRKGKRGGREKTGLPMDTTNLPDEPVADTEPRETGTKTRHGRKGTIDMGKVKALWNAGWTIPSIAEEMNCSKQGVYHVLHRIKDIEKAGMII